MEKQAAEAVKKIESAIQAQREYEKARENIELIK